MREFIEKFRELSRGESARNVFTLEWAMTVQECLKALCNGDNLTVSGEVTRTPGDGKVHLAVKPSKFRPISGPGPARRTGCAFGEIIRYQVSGEGGDPDVWKTGIRGGNIFCGDQNWVMPALEINPTAYGVWLVWIEVSVVCNIDDDGEVILPGISTGTRPDDIWSKIEYTEGTNYPPNENPTLPTGAGKIILPIGALTIIEGGQTLSVGVGCGNFFIDQCAGTLAFRKTI